MQSALVGVAARTGLSVPGETTEDEIIGTPEPLAPHSDDEVLVTEALPSPSIADAVSLSPDEKSGTVSPSLPSPISGLSPDHSPMPSPGDDEVQRGSPSDLGATPKDSPTAPREDEVKSQGEIASLSDSQAGSPALPPAIPLPELNSPEQHNADQTLQKSQSMISERNID